MAIENIQEVKEYLESNAENEEVKGFIDGLQKPLTRDIVEDWTKEGEGKSWLDRNCDIYSNKAVETARKNAIEKFKAEELPKLQEEYFKTKTGEGLTEDQKKLIEMQKQIDEMNAEKEENKRIQGNAQKLKEKGLNTDLAKFISNDDDISFFEGLIKNAVAEGIKAKIGESAYKPPVNGGNEVTKESFDKMSYKEKLELYKNNKALYDSFTK